jgi:hypothetical protein
MVAIATCYDRNDSIEGTNSSLVVVVEASSGIHLHEEGSPVFHFPGYKRSRNPSVPSVGRQMGDFIQDKMCC